MDLEVECLRIVADQFQLTPEETRLDLRFVEDLAATSFDYVEIRMALMQAFDVELPAQGQSVRTVGDLVALVEKLKPR